MITIIPEDVLPQGSEEWLELRKKYVTGTSAIQILQGKTIDEVILAKNNAKPFHGNYYTKRGHDLEPEARHIYSEVYHKVQQAGFILNDKYPKAAMSPDGIVEDNALIEIKCFQPERHFKVYKNLDPSILAQIQFGLFVSERDWCDLILYNPDLDDLSKQFLVRRIEPIPETQQKFKEVFTKLLTDAPNESKI